MKLINIANILTLASVMILYCGCTTTTLYDVVQNVNKTLIYPIDVQGEYLGTERITQQDILLELDLPDNAQVKKIDIRSINYGYGVTDENQARVIKLSGSIIDLDDNKPVLAFEDFVLTVLGSERIAVVGRTGKIPIIGTIDILLSAGIAKLKEKMDKFIRVANESYMEITLNARPNTEGDRMSMVIAIAIDMTVTYDICVETLDILSSEESTCEL